MFGKLNVEMDIQCYPMMMFFTREQTADIVGFVPTHDEGEIMPTSKVQYKLYLQAALIDRLHELHPSYGEAGRKVRELVEEYVRKETERRGKATKV